MTNVAMQASCTCFQVIHVGEWREGVGGGGGGGWLQQAYRQTDGQGQRGFVQSQSFAWHI